MGLFAATHAHAEQAITLPPLDAARLLIETKNYPAAELVLDAYLKGMPEDVEGRFLLGFAKGESGDYGGAIEIYRNLLVMHPDRTRIRLELARMEFLNGDYDDSQYNFELVLSGDIPDGVRHNVAIFLDQINQKRTFIYSASAALAPSTNVNNATSASQVSIFGAPATLSANARQQSGVGLSISASAERVAPIYDDWRARLGFSGYDRDYPSGQFDDYLARIYAGAQHLGQGEAISVLAVTDRRWYGNTRFDDRGGARLEYVRVIADRWVLSSALELLRDWFPTTPTQSGPEYSLTFAPRYTLNSTTTVGFTEATGALWSQVGFLGEHSYSLGGYYNQEFPGGITLNIQPQIQRTLYDGINPLFGTGRQDTAVALQATVSDRAWRIGNFTPYIGYSHTQNHSNITLFTFNSDQLLLGFQHEY